MKSDTIPSTRSRLCHLLLQLCCLIFTLFPSQVAAEPKGRGDDDIKTNPEFFQQFAKKAATKFFENFQKEHADNAAAAVNSGVGVGEATSIGRKNNDSGNDNDSEEDSEEEDDDDEPLDYLQQVVKLAQAKAPREIQDVLKARNNIKQTKIATKYSSSSGNSLDYGIFDWIHNSSGGYFNPKQQYRYDDDHDKPGIFAIEDIQKGELLLKVPWTHILSSKEADNDEEEEMQQMNCGTVEALAKQLRLGSEKSKYGPYIQYLNSLPDNLIPSGFSVEAKQLLQQIVGGYSVYNPEIPPEEITEWLETDWYDKCDGNRKDKLSMKAALLVVAKSDDNILIPGYDMYNHRNNDDDDESNDDDEINNHRWYNTITQTYDDGHIELRTSRNIKIGEQIYITYNHCGDECSDRDTKYGTAEIFRDYGFIENFPQEWHYYHPNPIQFVLDYDYDDIISEREEEEEKSYKLTWHSSQLKPDEENYQMYLVELSKQIRRLRRIRNLAYTMTTNNTTTALVDLNKIPTDELHLIWEFLEANIIALRAAINAIKLEFVDVDVESESKDDSKKDTSSSSVDGSPANGNNNDQQDVCTAADDGTCSSSSSGPDGKAVTTNTADTNGDGAGSLLLPYFMNGSHYANLKEPEFDELYYHYVKCDMFFDLIRDFNDHYDILEEIHSNYQEIIFAINEDLNDDGGDMCLEIDSTIQICDSYRPQYHEFIVHNAARFIPELRRVIFLGGGDSMILHEVLKYPSLELVVGLELDQVVVRKSFKYFHTQPHFDDPRVEWWFGDATKSLLLLPKEYWQSFDLVLVDLSETVMSLSVTDELDVFDALGLLLKPTGVMVKNEWYFNGLSQAFDYTAQIYYDCPMICDQAMVMGSNTVDFFNNPTYDHNIDTLLYKPLATKENHLDFIHDYRKNDARKQGKCDTTSKNSTSFSGKQETAAGILAIVNAEKTNLPVDEGPVLAELFRVAINSIEEFTLLSSPIIASDGAIYCVMKEGYIVARFVPDENYCAFDINLWGNFHKMKNLQHALLEVVGSTEVSAYRIVVGGMFGSSTWKEDQSMIGPQIVPTRTSCNITQDSSSPIVETDSKDETTTATATATAATSLEMLHSALQWTTNELIPGKDYQKPVVFCNLHEGCVADSFYNTIGANIIFTCPSLDKSKGEASEEDMRECEIETLSKLQSLVDTDDDDDDDAKSKLGFFVVDASVPYSMMQILHSIFGVMKDRKALINDQNLFIVLSTNPKEEEWMHHFLDRYRKQHQYDPVTKADFLLRSGENTIGIGVVSCGNDKVAYNLERIANQIQESSHEYDKDIVVELRSMIGGRTRYMDDFDPQQFTQSDYNSNPGIAQFDQQKPFGRQNIFQLVPDEEEADDLKMSESYLKKILESGIRKFGFHIQSYHEFRDVGDGSVHIIICNKGSIVAVWDGRNHIDINLFTFDELVFETENFIDAVIRHTKKTARLALRDDQPRGVRRVINFPTDMIPKD